MDTQGIIKLMKDRKSFLENPVNDMDGLERILRISEVDAILRILDDILESEKETAASKMNVEVPERDF